MTLQVAREIEGDEWKIAEILDMIRKEINALEWSRKLVMKSPTKTEKGARPFRSPPATTKSFAAKNDADKKRQLQCFFCKKDHYANQCKEITDLKERKSMLMKENRYFNWLRKGHVAKNCGSASKCYKCKGKHNTAICHMVDRSTVEEKEDTTDDKALATAVTKAKSNVLLQTAKTYAFGEDRPKRLLKINLFSSSFFI